MGDSGKILVAGLGSAHGDDQAGWLVADQLLSVEDLGVAVTIRKADVPLDIIDWLEDVDVLHICDACYSEFRGVAVHQFRWSEGNFVPFEFGQGETALAFVSMHHGGSHDYGVLEVVRLAEATRQLPRVVVVWAICGTAFSPDDVITSDTLLAVAETTRRICHALQVPDPSNA